MVERSMVVLEEGRMTGSRMRVYMRGSGEGRRTNERRVSFGVRRHSNEDREEEQKAYQGSRRGSAKKIRKM